jgi:hypothetical protein
VTIGVARRPVNEVIVRIHPVSKALLALILAAGLACQPGSAQDDSWTDDELATYLMRNGVAVNTRHASLWFDSGALGPNQMDRFSKLVNQGIVCIEAYLGGSLEDSQKIRYFISNRVEISHSAARSIFLRMDMVRDRTAPYLHETTHVVTPCDSCPMWFSEGLASYVQSYISEHAGGYDGGVFSQSGNRGINRDARRWLASDSGQAVAQYIGVPGEPPAINYDRSNVAAPFYVMAQSFVRFIVKRASIHKIRRVSEADDFDSAMLSATGKSAAQWKEEWLAELRK